MKNELYIIKKMIKTRTYLFLMLLTLITSIFFFVISGISDNIHSRYFECITNIWSVGAILLITAGVTAKFLGEIKNNTNYCLRFNDKESFFKKNFKVIVILNTIILLINYLVPFVVLLVSNLNKEIVNHDVYNISMIVYLTFFVFKNIILINLLNILYFVFSLTSKRLSYLYFLLILYIVISPVNITINKFSFDPSYYFIGVTYSNFILEVSYTILYISLSHIIIYLLYRSYLKLKIDL